MKTVRRLLYRDVLSAVAFVALAFLSLFYFIDFVETLDSLGRRGKSGSAAAAAWLSLLELPGHFYELFPIAVLIGSIFALARLAHSSEFTILRTGGLGPGRALALLSTLALGFAITTFVVGDFVAPQFDRHVEAQRAAYTSGGGAVASGRGVWLKDRQLTPAGERSFSVNVGAVRSDGELERVRIYEFDSQGALRARTEATRARVDGDGHWRLQQARRTEWRAERVVEQALDDLAWNSGIDTDVLNAAISPPKNMSTVELYRYTAHLSAHEQSAQQHDIQFWRKALYPFACFVMVALALPFAYLHSRNGGISLKVFGGIMLGISFVLLNNLAGHLGMLKGWTPWAVAATPSLIYLGISLAAFGWLVRYR